MSLSLPQLAKAFSICLRFGHYGSGEQYEQPAANQAAAIAWQDNCVFLN